MKKNHQTLEVPRPFSPGFFLRIGSYTPQNKHDSPENGPLEKEIPNLKPSFPGSMLICWGVFVKDLLNMDHPLTRWGFQMFFFLAHAWGAGPI